MDEQKWIIFVTHHTEFGDLHCYRHKVANPPLIKKKTTLICAVFVKQRMKN